MEVVQRLYKFLRFWYMILVLAFPSMVEGQDSLSVPVAGFDQHALDGYRSQQAFKYETDTPPEQMGILDWIKYKIGEMLSKFFDTRSGGNLLNVVLYGVMIFAVVAIILNLAGIDPRRFLTGDARTVTLAHISEENIRELNIDELISDAVAKKDWRLAVRYQYLKALRLMADRELIHWRAGKTNMDYYAELEGENMRGAFLVATDDFESVWYGNGGVTERHYNDSRSALGKFYELIQQQKAG